jgi:hypothetical protein
MYLGLLVGHYMHRSMLHLHGVVPPGTLNPLCSLASLLAFLPLHLVCTHLEMTEGLASGGKRVKGAHNYLGNMDLIISYYMHACARAQLSNAPDITQFGVFYLRELVECPAPVWDPRHRNLCDYVFEGAPKTTRAELVVYNAARVGGVSLVIERAWLYGVTSMAAAQPIVILGQVAAAGLVAAPTDGTTTVVQTSLSGKAVGLTRAGVALFALANTAFALANHWMVLGNGLVPAPTTNLGAAVEANCYGRYIIPPQGAFLLNAVAGTAAGTAVMGVEYHDVLLALGN